MFKTFMSLKLKLMSLQSLIVLSVCLYYFIGMQVSTTENIDPKLILVYKVAFIGGILVLFLTFLAFNYRSIVSKLLSRSGICTLIIWLCLILVTKQPSLIFMLFIVLTFYKKDYKKMTGYLFIWLSVLFLTFIILSSFGFINAGEIIKYNLLVDSSEYKSVTALGMGNPNTAMAFFLGLVMSGSYIFYDSKYKNKFGVLMLIASLVLYSFVGSRTGIICTLIFLFLFLFDNRKLASYLKLLTPLFTILLIALSIFVGFKYGQTENNVNDLLTTRPYQWHLRLDNGALTNLFNNSDTYVKDVVDQSVSFPLDNQYIYLLARAGWLPLIAVMILYFIGNRRNKSPIIIYMIFTSIVLCFVESLMFTAIVNVGLIFILSNLLLVDYKGGET